MGATRGMLIGVKSWGGGGEQPRWIEGEGEAERVESERETEGEEKLCLHTEISKDNPSASVKWRSGVQCCGG